MKTWHGMRMVKDVWESTKYIPSWNEILAHFEVALVTVPVACPDLNLTVSWVPGFRS